MFIWLLVAVLVGGFALIGHQSGAIRSGVAFVGVILGLALNGVLTPITRTGLAAMGVKDQIALLMIPGLIIFAVFWLIFLGLGIAAHRPVEMYYKYKTDELSRLAFGKMNQGFGLFVGLLSGICVFLSVGSFVYKYGYVAVQMETDTGEQAPIHYLSQIRQDMESSGWDKAFASIDSTPATFYQRADLLGTLHNNPLVQGRLATYPPFLRLAEMQEFTDIGGDKDYQDLLQQKASLAVFWNNPKTQTILNNQDIMKTLTDVNLQDFLTYLSTANSPQYQDDKILGRWRLDVGAVFNHMKRAKQTMTVSEIRRLKAGLTPVLSGISLTAYADGRFKLNVVPPTNAPVLVAVQQPSFTPQNQPTLTQRYRLSRGPMAPQQGATVFVPAQNQPPKPIKIQGLEGTVEGTWTRGNGTFLLRTDGTKEDEEAMINDTGRLFWTAGAGDLRVTLFFVRMI